MEKVIVSYLRKIWNREDWLFEGQHGFRPVYSCENQAITVCQDSADSLDSGGSIDAVNNRFFEGFRFRSHDRLITNIAASGVDSRAVV
jgi:hypothetical protein